MTRVIRTVITDDEPSGRGSVRALLAQDPQVETVAECATGPETASAVMELRPDLLFLDVQLPGESGVQVLERIPPDVMPVVVFVTAYEDYALRAFDVHAADYLLKPYSDARFHVAVGRAKQRLEQQAFDRMRRALVDLAEKAQAERLDGAVAPRRRAGYVDRLTARTPGGLTIVPVGEIEWLEAAGDYVCVHGSGPPVLARTTMATLERRLDPMTFVRIHRSTIVNVHFLREIKGSAAGEHFAVLKDGTTRPVSGRGREQLVRVLDVRL